MFCTWGKEHQAEAALQYGRVWKDQLDDHEKESILEPFKFTFYSTKDMWTFCEEIMDKRNVITGQRGLKCASQRSLITAKNAPKCNPGVKPG